MAYGITEVHYQAVLESIMLTSMEVRTNFTVAAMRHVPPRLRS